MLPDAMNQKLLGGAAIRAEFKKKERKIKTKKNKLVGKTFFRENYLN